MNGEQTTEEIMQFCLFDFFIILNCLQAQAAGIW